MFQEQQSNVPFHLGKKGRKCNIKDMIYPFSRNRKEEERKSEPLSDNWDRERIFLAALST